MEATAQRGWRWWVHDVAGLAILVFVRRVFAAVGVLALLVLLGGCGSVASSRRAGSGFGPSGGYLDIVAGGAAPVLARVVDGVPRLDVGGRSYRLVGRAAGEGCNSLVRSPGGRYVLYGVSQGGRPALELLDLRSGARRVFREHACDLAWGRDGEIAYLRYRGDLLTPGNDRYSTQAVVQQGLGGVPRAWTRWGSWETPVWAGRDLLLGSARGLVVLYGPGRERGVDGYPAGPNGPFVRVVAVSPGGGEALLDTQRLGPGGGGAGAVDRATLLSVGDGRVLSQVVVSARGVASLAAGGDWQGDEIVTTDGYFQGGSSHPRPALVILTAAAGRVRIRAVWGFLEHGEAILGQDLADASQARFLGAGGQRVAVLFHLGGESRYLVCDLRAQRCTAGRDKDEPR